jgi:hypothetical protein
VATPGELPGELGYRFDIAPRQATIGTPHSLFAVLSWFVDYLTNRMQYVSINDENSNMARVECGVPQGSILGPLLFFIFY